MAGQLTISTLNDSSGVLATQNGMSGIAKAWVIFGGGNGTAIRESFNVSSITDNGVGDYTVNFTTAMPDANYAVACMAGGTSRVGWSRLGDTPAPTTSAYRIYVANSGGTVLLDAAFVIVAIFR